MLKLLLISLISLSTFADTAPPGIIKIKGATDGTPIGNVGDALKVSVTGGGSSTVNQGSPNGGGVNAWPVQGSLGRTWSLSSGSDSVTSFQGAAPWAFNLTQLLGAAPSVTNTLPIRISNGTSFVDPTQIRALSSITDSVTTVPSGTQTVTVSGGTIVATQPTGSNLHTVVDSGSISATISGTPNVAVTNFPATQNVAVTNTPTVTVSNPATNYALETGGNLATISTNLTNGTQQSQISNGTNSVGVKQLSTQVVAADYGLITNSVIHGLTTGGGGGYVDVKVNPSGSLTVDASNSTGLTGTFTANAGTNLNTSALSLETTQSGFKSANHTDLAVINTTLGTPMQNSGGSVTANAGTGNFTVVQATGSNLHVAVDSVPTTTVTGTVTANSGTNLNTSALNLETTQSAFKSANHADLTSVISALGSPFQAGGSIGNTSFGATQATAANLNATVVTTGGATIAKDSSVTGLQVTQGSTTSGQSGSLVQGAVTTSVPSYTTSQTSPVSLNLHGATRVINMGGDTAQIIRNDYSSTNVTTAAYVQLVASTSVEINRLYISDTSGQDFVLATGGAGSEVDQIQIPPGGWDMMLNLYIPSGTRISIKSKSATATSGILNITGLK